MSQRDHNSTPHSMSTPMHSPRIEGAGVLSSRGVLPSPLGKSTKEPARAGSSPTVDYDDVFGGPPRFATSMYTSQLGPLPSGPTLDRATSRTPSFRSSSLPVFELPVFGEDIFGSGSSNTYDSRPASVAYEDIFKEEGRIPDVFPVSSLYGNSRTGISRSKPSSRSSSRRMSPEHPAAAFPGQHGQDKIPVSTSSATFLKPRPGAGKFTSRCSFSSLSAFDESRGKPLDSPFTVLRSDPVTSSLPSSPPNASPWDHLTRVTGSNSSISIGEPTSVEVDDVFGGFPKRSYPQPLSTVQYDAREALNALGTNTVGALEKPYLKSSVTENKVRSSSATAHNSDTSESIIRTLSSSSSSNDEQGLHDNFIEIRMDRQSDSSVSEKVEVTAGKAWITVNDLSLLTRPSHKPPPARPPPAPAAQLKFKSWKDWASDLPASHSASISSSGSTCDSVLEATTAEATVSAGKEDLNDVDAVPGYVKGWVETLPSKQSDDNLSAQQYPGNFFGTSTVGSQVETVEMEERELQALLANAWKINEKRESEKKIGKLAQELPKVSEVKEQEPHWNERRKQRQSKASQPQQSSQVNYEDREVDLHWKEWRKYASKERKEVMKSGGAADNSATKTPNLNGQVSVQDGVGGLAEMNVVSEVEYSLDTEEIVKVVTEEMSTNYAVASTGVSADGWAGIDPNKKLSKGVAGAHENAELPVTEQAFGRFNGLDGAAKVQNSVNGSVQDFVQYDEQLEVSFSGGVEDIECFLGLASSLDGFQEIEGESLERRKSRCERHVRARERAAKALEEMQQRDAQVLRQQEEKQQLAETSDRQIKRWAAGKEGNLRALLSNLQHVLWSESGWQPIPLTDLIEGPDVKKAYRKATLFVHPDKLQQKGATMHQKYIAERVFDILQEAWKTFNLQELF